MMDKKEVLAIIPARGNSKTIPRKNIRLLGGFPLIAYSIAAAVQSKAVTRTIVTTDDPEIAEIARQYGAETPFLRPAEFSQDDTLDLPVFQHALKWLMENEAYHPDIVIQLRPTSPFRPHDLLDRAMRLLLDHPGADSVRGVVPSGQNPFKMWTIAEDGAMRPVLTVEGIKEAYNAPRQELPDTYWQTGHIDAIRPDAILKKNSMSGDVILPLLIDPVFTVDIDTLLDWQRAESCVLEGRLDMVSPGRERIPFPDKVKLLVMDFDGVMTDDRVWVDQDGREMVAANRSDGLGLERLRTMTEIQVLVLSRESNPVVTERCRKMNLPVLQNVKDKASALQAFLAEKNLLPEEVIYIGNDVNDLPCFPLAGYKVVPADAQDNIKQQADLVLQRNGGFGAVRELCEMLIAHNPRR
jgi:YrbI family 3-deoxy-D-manno-octulosonate 8-phosphate phosphatase